MKKLTAKIFFDVAMATLWIILMIYSITGAFWHEVIGLAAIGLILVHLGYNVPLLKKTCSSMFKKGHGTVTVKYLLDIGLFFFSLFTGLSGVLVSKEILVGLTVSNIGLWVWLHNWSALLTIILISVHIGLHWKMVATVFMRPFRGLRQNRRLALTGRILWNLVAASFIIYGFIVSTGYHIPPYIATADAAAADRHNAEEALPAPSFDLSASVSDSPSLDEYLGSLFCTACSKHCSLLAPECSRGVDQASAAQLEYNNLYNPPASQSPETSEPTGSTDPVSASETAAPASDEGRLHNSTAEILSIMGLYIGGTYYVSALTGRLKKKRSPNGKREHKGI